MRNWKERLLKSLLDTPSEAVQERFQKTHIATCAILLEIAKSDYEFSTVEKETTQAILKNEFGIPEEDIEDLMKIAAEKREDSVDLWEFTNLINQNFSKEEKLKIIESAWKIIYADDKLDKYEDHLVHVLAKLLRLDHEDLIEAKLGILYADRTDDDDDDDDES
ncbi:MAG: TerB family tellurite resistance protein [Candidatus Aminicenantes bacterium]|nr:TerB family tellurite resistance protein [Candidatus Aminicenantes bacterium]